MVDMHNVRTFNADTRFKAGYLNELEKMLEKALPHAMLKAKPNLESKIRTLKRDWVIVYDMLSGKNNSDFGWDEYRQLVVAEDAVWNSYINNPANSDIVVSLIMTNLLSSTQKIKPQGKMLKQLLILLKK
ncbi:hypothetical protein Godav_025942 [Gossypium davidsonii]|uniref:Myb/SANT-like domain-containing protein n=2 Tax=Gossypium TaxID=3633 RepID=A0A7J8TBW0_GOSDV|nr:hypothetical protein [Gossypium davidsonii]MBA0671445.1 hypothetical protein [Gossypium klotzschianum]